jgi:hypothetical protein
LAWLGIGTAEETSSGAKRQPALKKILPFVDGNGLVFVQPGASDGAIPTNPHAAFDHNVLELIELSPVGAVPGTPAYQDALGRLRSSHQVYPDAEHHDGFVTVRTLATRPCFRPNNLDALLAGAIDVERLETNASIFDRYVSSLPMTLRGKAEAFRAAVAGRPTHHRKHHGVVAADAAHILFLVPGAGAHPGIPGNYLHGAVLQLGADRSTSTWAVHVHDRDDGAALLDVPTLAAALAAMQDVIASAPFHLSELAALGFRPN